MKKVLYCITKSNWGGAQRYVFDMATAAKEAGFDVIVAYGGEGDLARRLQEVGIRGVSIPALGRNVSIADLAAYRSLHTLFKNERPDVVHLNSSKVGMLGSIAARVAKVPRIIFTAHGWAFNEDRSWWQKAAIWLAHYATVLLTHYTIAVSHAVLRGARHMPFVAHKIILIPLGISVPNFLSREEARAALAQKAGASADSALWIGLLAELTWNKGLHHLIRAASELKQRGAQFVVYILGEGEERKFLETLIEEQGLQAEVRLPGFVANGQEYLRAFDIFVLPSHTEALSYALIEAGYAGLPVVASNVGGVPEVVDDKMSGLLVPPANPAKLAEALGLLIENAEKRQQYGQALRAAVEKKFALTRMCEQTLVLY